MIAATRKESPGFGSAQFTTSTPKEARHFEGVDFSKVRARANAAKKELLSLCQHRLEVGEPLNKRNAAYLWGRALHLFRAGIYRDTRGKNWTRYKRQYFFKWLAPTPANFFEWLGDFDPSDAEREAVESGLRAARKSKAKGLVDPDKAAAMLEVKMAERTLLGLRTIGAIDCSKEERKALAVQKKRKDDRTRAATQRAAAGARPRSQSYVAVKPWEAFGESRRTFYNRDKVEREAMLQDVIASSCTNSSQIISAEPLARDELVHGGDCPNSSPADNVIRLPLRQAAAFTRATGVRIGAAGWREKFDAFANDDIAGALNAPPPDIAEDDAPPPAEEIARWDWWRQPVEGWREGKLEIRSILTGESHTIRMSDGAILSHTPKMEEEHEYE